MPAEPTTSLGLADWSAGLAAIGSLPPAVLDDVRDAIALARRFNDEIVRPAHLEIDRMVQDDPGYLPHEFIATANRWGMFTRWIPRMFGGGGWNVLSLYVFLEEISSVCVGLANVIGVHYLGVATLTATWNTALMWRVFAEVSAGERSGEPQLISLAITEPAAGTDMEETELLGRARIGTVAVRQEDGGYLLNGRKVFISNGHVSTWHLVVTCEDRRRAADTTVMLAVKTGAPGFSFGAKENKMGQKACVASELIFDNCRVPAEQVALGLAAGGRLDRRLNRTPCEITQVVIDYVVSSTRAGVGAFAAGVARGAFQTARDYAARRTIAGGRLIEQQWAQSILAQMAMNAALARQAYLEAACANNLGGLFQMQSDPIVHFFERRVPAALWTGIAGKLLRHPRTVRYLQRRGLGEYPAAWERLTSGLASMAKVACSDLAIANAGLGIELMGADGLRHDRGAEKYLRDAKLLQIYEGTNQLNRINLFKCRIRPDDGVRVFIREAAQ